MQKANNSKIQFLWEGKEEALKECNTPPQHNYEIPETVDGNEIHCVDNLDFLKNNLERLRGKVKCIYIDPPYNTGNDFIYKDKIHARGECKHSKWLSFMYPRLMVARELLQENGVIFISIDDNEVHHLRLLMNEVFGEGEFVMFFIRKTVSNRAMAKYSNTQHEYTLCFSKDISNAELVGKDKDLSVYQNSDNDPNGAWVSGNPSRVGGYVYEVINPYTGKIDTPPKGRGWVFKKENIEKLLTDGVLVFKKEHKKNERGFIIKNYIKDLNSETSLVNSLDTCDNKFMNQVATKELIELMGDKYFDFPKPVSLIKHLLQISTAPGDLILDFFAGSGTTGQAVMELNQEEIDKQAKDGLLADKTAEVGGRKFILVQLPEKIDEKKEAFKAGYKKISDITIERVKRAGEKYKSVDVNFKVFNYA